MYVLENPVLQRELLVNLRTGRAFLLLAIYQLLLAAVVLVAWPTDERLDLTSNPKNSVINISGNTILSGEEEEIENFLKQENEKTPEVVSLIYQELFPLMYIITKNMKIPAPSHTITQIPTIELGTNGGQTMNNKQTTSDDKIEQETMKTESEPIEEPKSDDIESNKANPNESNES